MSRLLDVHNLKTCFHTDYGLVKAVDGVSFYVREKEIIGCVGESGCGKSVSQLSVLQLISTPPGQIVGGTAMFEGVDLLKHKKNGPEMRAIRGAKISMIFQEPMTSLNPVLTIKRQLTETLEVHFKTPKREARDKSIEMLRMVGIPNPETRMENYPHQFSGGMRQRVMIAIALLCQPKIVIADEPTTALDVTTQAQLLELIRDLVNELGMSVVLVTHNLGIVARYAQRLYVMYAGRIVESGTTKEIFGDPRHPYTIALLKSLPRLDDVRHERLLSIAGMPPNLINMPSTCAYLPRCSSATDQCKQQPWPALALLDGQHYVSCYADDHEV